MARTVFGKVMWVGRATVFLIGLTVTLALVFGVAATALAAVPGDPLKLGRLNTINALTQLAGSVNNAVLKIDNDSTGASASALDLRVEPGKAPMKVNSKTRVSNLNSDQLDGKDSTAFLPEDIYAVSASRNIQPGSGAGATASCDARDPALSGGYHDLNANLDVYLDQRVAGNTNPETGEIRPSGWLAVASNPLDGSDGVLEVQAHCADFPPAHAAPGGP